MMKVHVVMYHYVRPIKAGPLPRLKGLEVSAFRDQIRYLCSNFSVVTMEQVVAALRGEDLLPPAACLLTFDDGYKDHYEYVFPTLAEHKVQGSFFIPVSTVVDRKILDVNKIHYILASVEEGRLVRELEDSVNKLSGQSGVKSFAEYRAALAISNRWDSSLTILVKRLLQRELPLDIRSSIVDSLFRKYVTDDQAEFAASLYMSRADVMELKNAGMHIGAHGYDHLWWTSLSDDELELELVKSMEFLRSIGALENGWTACYPYGAYNVDVVAALDRLNCAAAFTTEAKIAKLEAAKRLTIPRLDTNDFPPVSANYKEH